MADRPYSVPARVSAPPISIKPEPPKLELKHSMVLKAPYSSQSIRPRRSMVTMVKERFRKLINSEGRKGRLSSARSPSERTDSISVLEIEHGQGRDDMRALMEVKTSGTPSDESESNSIISTESEIRMRYPRFNDWMQSRASSTTHLSSLHLPEPLSPVYQTAKLEEKLTNWPNTANCWNTQKP